jgi:hypothetical protein
MRLVVAVVALMAATHLLAQPPERDVWVGILTYDGASNGSVPAAPGVMLRPVSALVGGTWRSESENGGDELESGSDGSVRWPPAARDLPRSWIGWLIDGRREIFDVSGPPRATGVFDMAGVAARVRPPRPPADAWSDDILGVAVSGRVVVHPFVDVEGPDRRQVSDVMSRAMVNAEVKEIATRTAGADESWLRTALRTAADIPLARLAAGAYDVNVHRTATLAVGVRTVVLEGFKSLASTEGCNSLRSGVAVEQRVGRPPRVLGAWTYLICNELSVTHRPLAVIERDGRSCWVSEYMYEDGVRYVLMPPGDVGDESPVSRCSIR